MTGPQQELSRQSQVYSVSDTVNELKTTNPYPATNGKMKDPTPLFSDS
jgi:hypothetical protein